MASTKTVVINKKSIDFLISNGENSSSSIYELPKLSDTDKLHRIRFWEIYVIDNKIFRKSYQDGGKIREFPAITSTGKNIGKVNETTDHNQALFEAFGLWTKKQTQGYIIHGKVSEPLVDDTDQTSSPLCLLPMLANKYDQRYKHLQLPFGISRKLDGIRVLGVQSNKVRSEGSRLPELQLFSRLGKPFSFLENIRTSVNLFLRDINNQHSDIIVDGELYSHNLPFNAISGAVRTKKTKSIYDDQIELWIFDIIDKSNISMRYEDRMRRMKELETVYNMRGGHHNLHFVYYDICTTHDDVSKYHDQYVYEGFEGAMCRNLSGPYLFKNRSNDLLKYKTFEDSEFIISNAKPGVGTEEGAIVFECICENGKFDVRPRGSIEKRCQMYREKENYIGKKLTVRYQPHTNEADQQHATGIPRFPVGIDIRDYE